MAAPTSQTKNQQTNNSPDRIIRESQGYTPQDLQDVNIEGLNSYRPYTTRADDFEPTVATIILSGKGSGVIPLLPDVGQNYLGIFKNFSLTNFNEGRQEEVNITKTFGREWVAFFYGENPRIYNYGGHFLDFKNYPYYEEFIKAYDNYLRGTKCIENEMELYLSYNGRLVRGLMTGIGTGKTSGVGVPKGLVQFNFTILVLHDGWVGTRNEMALTNVERLRQSGVRIKANTGTQNG